MPWFDCGHSYPWPGPPQERTRFPAWSKTSTGGAAVQHSPVFKSRARSLSLSVAAPRWMIQTWSWSSTQTPIVMPSSQ
jgi:hypothetical protein